MRQKHDLQMLITVLVLIIAAVSSLFQREVSITHVVELYPIESQSDSVHTYLIEDVATNVQKLVDRYGDIKSFELINISTSLDSLFEKGRYIEGEVAFAEKGSNDFIILGKLNGNSNKGENTDQWGSRLTINDFGGQELSELMESGRMVTFKLTATADSYPANAAIILRFDSKMTVDII
jgi:hypothetical protein